MGDGPSVAVAAASFLDSSALMGDLKALLGSVPGWLELIS